MIGVKTILVPVDFSDTSRRVLGFGRLLADALGASLHLLHVIAYPIVTPQTLGEKQQDACDRLEALLDRTDREIRHATTSCQVGTPASEICRHAADHAIDLIVMGTHYREPVWQMATGSIAEAVVGSAPCAVLVVKGAQTSNELIHEDAAMTVGDICNRNVVVAPKAELIVDAAKRMRTSHVGDLVVVENRNGRHVPVGILTDRDIVISVVAGNPDHIHYLLVGDVMSSNLVTAQEEDSIEMALKRMQEHGVRRLPIVDEAGTLVGILTLDDVLEFLTAQQSELVALVAREQRHERQYRV